MPGTKHLPGPHDLICIANHHRDVLLASEQRSSAVVTIRADWACFPLANPFPCDLADFLKFELKMPKTLSFYVVRLVFFPGLKEPKFFFQFSLEKGGNSTSRAFFFFFFSAPKSGKSEPTEAQPRNDSRGVFVNSKLRASSTKTVANLLNISCRAPAAIANHGYT